MSDEEESTGKGEDKPDSGDEEKATGQEKETTGSGGEELAAEEEEEPAVAKQEKPGRKIRPRRVNITTDLPHISNITIILVVVFVAIALALMIVINLEGVREAIDDDTFLWYLRWGLGLMILTYVVYLVYTETMHLKQLRQAILEIERTNKDLDLLLEDGREIGSTLILDDVLKLFLDVSLTQTDADFGAFYAMQKDKQLLELSIARGLNVDRMAVTRVEPGKGVVGTVARTLVKDVIDEVVALDDDKNAFRGAAAPASQFLLPVLSTGELLGVLAVGKKVGSLADREEAVLLQGLGEFVGLSITNANLYQQVADSLEELALQRGITDTMLENMMAGVIIADKEGRISVFNKEAQRMTGFRSKEIIGGSLTPELSLEENPFSALHQGMFEVLNNINISKEGESVVLNKDKSLVKIDYRIYPLTDGEEALGVVSVFIESESEDKEGRLGDMDYSVMLRSLSARIERLYAYPVSRAIEKIKGMSSEEFPVLREGIVKELKLGSANLLGLLEDVEQYLGCVSVREWDTPVMVEPAELAGEAVERIIKETKGEGVVVLIDLGDLPPVFGYRRMMRAALEEVIENAVIAAAQSDKKVHVTGQQLGSYVRLSVRDKGPGIKDIDNRFLYLPFFTTREGGSGLGLSIVKRIMQHIGGRYGVEEGEEGLVFFLEFPTAKPSTGNGEGEA